MTSRRPSVLRTDAVVLRSLDYGETSRIVTLFTRDKGKVGVMARGARSPRSRFGSTLEPMAHIQAVIHERPGRELQTLSEASHIRIRPRLVRRVDRLEPAMRSIELVHALMQSEQAMPPVLDTLVEVMDLLDRTDSSGEDAGDDNADRRHVDRSANAWPFFALRLASLLGLAPVIDRESLDRLEGDAGWLQLDTGTISEERGPAEAVRASRSALRAFGICARADLETVMRMRMSSKIRRDVETLVDAYMRYHVEEAYPDRAARVFGRLHGE